MERVRTQQKLAKPPNDATKNKAEDMQLAIMAIYLQRYRGVCINILNSS